MDVKRIIFQVVFCLFKKLKVTKSLFFEGTINNY